jgi:hypothetical protein
MLKNLLLETCITFTKPAPPPKNLPELNIAYIIIASFYY